VDFKRIFNKEEDIAEYTNKKIIQYQKQIEKMSNSHELTREQADEALVMVRECMKIMFAPGKIKGVSIVAAETFYREFCIQVLFSIMQLKQPKEDN